MLHEDLFIDIDGNFKRIGDDALTLLNEYLDALSSYEARVLFLRYYSPACIVEAEHRKGNGCIICDVCGHAIRCAKRGRKRKHCNTCRHYIHNRKRYGDVSPTKQRDDLPEYATVEFGDGYSYYVDSAKYESYVRRNQASQGFDHYENYITYDGIVGVGVPYYRRAKKLRGTTPVTEIERINRALG